MDHAGASKASDARTRGELFAFDSRKGNETEGKQMKLTMTEPSGLDETPPDVREAHSESERLSISYLSALAIVQAHAPQY